jgi:serine/threonine protein kinase
MATHANCLPIGTVIADFEIIGLVGEGGFGIVYLARDTSLDRVVALKEFMPSAFAGRVDTIRVAVRASNHQATYEAGLRSFINEARMLAKFAHPALVEVFRFWEGNGTAYMAMRYYAGETLRQKLSRGDEAFDEESIAKIMAPIFDALEMLHREQVFHRDIAPDNIMLSDGRPVLLDFGSARRIIGDGTQALTTILKPGYAPIEQYVDDGTMKQGPWTDVYALGGVLYHLATGKAPLQAVSRLLSDPLKSVNEVTDNRFSATFSSAVAKAMAVRVENRLQNIQEFSVMLGWNTVQPTRVLTLPSASSARPDPSQQVAAGAAPSVLNHATAQAVSVHDLPAAAELVAGELTAGGEQPQYPPQASGSLIRNSTLAMAFGVVVAVALAVYGYARYSSSTAPAVAPTPVSPRVVKTLPTVLPPAETVKPAASTPIVALVRRTGVVNLDVAPWGAIVVDGVTRGISNASQLRRIELPVGTHTIEIAKPDAPPFKQTIEVTVDAPLSISHHFK